MLKEQPLHGYELKKRLPEVLGPLSRVSFGSLYPALAKLEAAGAISVAAAADTSRPAIPMTGSLAGEAAAFRARRLPIRADRRGKKVYAITERGHALFEELLAAPADADDDRAFSLKLAFGRYLSPEARLRLLERRRAQLVERLEQARAAMRAASERLDAYARSLVEHDTESTERDISWLDRLIAAERPPADLRPSSLSDPSAPAADPTPVP